MVVQKPKAAPSRRRQCAWPIGEPRSKEFRFCGKPVVPGRPYCAEHVEKATFENERHLVKTAPRNA